MRPTGTYVHLCMRTCALYTLCIHCVYCISCICCILYVLHSIVLKLKLKIVKSIAHDIDCSNLLPVMSHHHTEYVLQVFPWWSITSLVNDASQSVLSVKISAGQSRRKTDCETGRSFSVTYCAALRTVPAPVRKPVIPSLLQFLTNYAICLCIVYMCYQCAELC